MADKRLLDIINKSIAGELQSLVQYMWQHVMAVGIASPAVRDMFEDISIEEMKHAEKLAERLDLLGGVPTTSPDPISVGGDLKQMIQNDIEAEDGAIALYKEAIKLATELNDPVTRLMFEELLGDEEEHQKAFRDLLE
ncbi:MAG TPA: ferritin-like domain-containing protein [Chloroflexota bacterium]